MKTLAAAHAETQNLPPYHVLTVVAASAAVGSVTRLGDSAGDPSQGRTMIAAGETKTIGPFAAQTRHEIACELGALTYDITPADFPAVSSDIERMVKLSQAEYDALSLPDDATLYVIVG
jgi:hypothetical protein